MHSPILFTLGLATAFARLSTAHTTFTTLFINDVNQGDATCIRMAKNGAIATSPLDGFDSDDMACGRDGQDAVAFTCPAAAGSKLSMEFREWPDASQPGSIDKSHVGPMAIYLKQVSDMQADSAAGPGWFKIWDEGYDTGVKKWATEKLMDNNGLFSINLPAGLPTGYYLVRHEIITLQNVTDNKADAQFYVGCAQLFVQGTAASDLPSDKQVSIPGHFKAGEPGLIHNVYTEDPSKYTVIGPEVFFPAAPSTNNKGQQVVKQTEGLIPTDCLVKNGNWCGTEVPDYSDATGCWAAADNCWKQLDVCYKSAPPTGSKGCKVWEQQKCEAITQACESRQSSGPSNKGEKLDGEVNQPIPGGKLPASVNAGQSGNANGNGNPAPDADENQGGEDGEDDTTPTPAPTPTGEVATPTETLVSRCQERRRRRDRQRRRMD